MEPLSQGNPRSAPFSWDEVDAALLERQADPGAPVAPVVSALRAQLAYTPEQITGLDQSYEALRTRIEARATKRPARKISEWQPRSWSRAGMTRPMLAMVAVLAMVGGVYAIHQQRHMSSSVESLAGERAWRTGVGQRANVRLADGSMVVLAPNSHLRVPAAFGGDTRQVHLDGQAVFTVTTESAPFIVQAGHTSVRVLGTTFGVRAYAADSMVRVAVTSGKVAVANGPALTMGEMLDMTPSGKMDVRRNADVVGMLSWTQGRLVFDAVPFAHVARDLERWYGMTIRIPDTQLATTPVSARFDNPGATDVLDALAITLGARYVRAGSEVTFHAR